LSYPATIVAAHEPHAFEARGQLVAMIFVDPESRQGRRLQQRHQHQGIAALRTVAIEQGISDLAAAFRARTSDAALIERARAIVDTLAGPISEASDATDERIARAVRLVRERIGESIPLGKIASAVNLSPDRFRHLFVAETGVTFRVYVLWLRLEQSLAAYVSGQSLTEAAFIGGFADSAHFSRTFRRMFGLAPASVRPE
jgi:transcriptional regulator GlxA family with amidase domain